MESRVLACLVSVCLEDARGGKNKGRERGALVGRRVSVRLDAVGWGTSGGRDRVAATVTSEVAAPADGARGKRGREAERSVADRRLGG